MAVEMDGKINASKSERTDERAGYRSGYRVRRYDTRFGTMYLFISKLRKGGDIPFFINEKKRSEVALLNVIQEAYINGVSTRKIEKLAKSLVIESISRSQLSQITNDLNDQVDEFRTRSLKKVYPVLLVDSLYEKIRNGNRVQNMAVSVVIGIDEQGQRDILSIEAMEESEETYKTVFNNLKERGLEETWLEDHEKQFTEAINILESWLEDSLQFYSFQQIDSHKIASTNMLERLNREIRRRTSVVGISPNIDAYIRLVTTYLIEYSEEWSIGTCYIKSAKIEELEENLQKLLS